MVGHRLPSLNLASGQPSLVQLVLQQGLFGAYHPMV